MEKGPRWDNDTRHRGIGGASMARPAVERLLAVLSDAEWVAEEPDQHLVPRLSSACRDLGLEMTHSTSDAGLLDVRVSGLDVGRAERRRVAFSLLGSVAEATTHIREEPGGTFEMVTGMLEGDGEFAPHGHVVRLTFGGPPGA